MTQGYTVNMALRCRKSLALLALAGLLLGAIWPAGGVALVRAESPAIVIDLSYVRGYSTWGPTNVTGVARLWPGEGVVVLNVHDLPHLPGGALYVAWLVNTSSGESLRLNTFNTSDAGDAEMDQIFDQALPRGANALLVTVGHPGDPAAMPGPQRTLVGYFPAQNSTPEPQPPASAASATPVPVAPAQETPAPTAPPQETPAPTAPAPTATPRARAGRGGAAPRTHHDSGGARARAHHPIVVILPQTGGASAALSHSGAALSR